jgi:hypothetical protein
MGFSIVMAWFPLVAAPLRACGRKAVLHAWILKGRMIGWFAGDSY